MKPQNRTPHHHLCARYTVCDLSIKPRRYYYSVRNNRTVSKVATNKKRLFGGTYVNSLSFIDLVECTVLSEGAYFLFPQEPSSQLYKLWWWINSLGTRVWARINKRPYFVGHSMASKCGKKKKTPLESLQHNNSNNGIITSLYFCYHWATQERGCEHKSKCV